MQIETRGFTLIELMIVVAIIGILAAIAIPMYGNLIAKSREGSTKANIGAIRLALSIYYGDNDGAYPMDAGSLDSLTTGGRYLQLMPPVVLPKSYNSPGHLTSTVVANGAADDSGGLLYDNDDSKPETWGNIAVNCTHEDIRGDVWSTY